MKLAIVMKQHPNGVAVRVLLAEGPMRHGYPIASSFRVGMFEAAAFAFRHISLHYGSSLPVRVWWLT